MQPKQIINKINYFKYLKNIFFNKKIYFNYSSYFQELFKIIDLKRQYIFLGRARAGIYLAVKISIIKTKRKKILIAPYTIPEIISLIKLAGGEPVYLDFEKKSFNLDIGTLNRILKNENKDYAALILTHYIQPDINIKIIKELCLNSKICLIEDCAINFSSKFDGEQVGNFGDFSIYSFSAFKFINFFYGGLITFNPEYNDQMKLITNDWKQLKNINYFSKFIETVKFDFLTNKNILNFFSKYLIKFLQKKNSVIEKNSYLNKKFKIDKSYFSLPSCMALEEIRDKSLIYNQNLYRRRKISKIYNGYLKKYSIPEVEDLEIDNYEYLHYLIIAKSKEHRNILKKKLLTEGYDVGKFFYADSSKFFDNEIKLKNIEEIENKIITLPTHKYITAEYAQELAKKISEIYD